MEDLDEPRCVPGAADDILHTLGIFGLYSDEPVLYQSRRSSAYDEALQQLQACGMAYPCCCTRKEVADSALNGIEGPVYPGTCRHGIPVGRTARAWRVRTNNDAVKFEDRLQGFQSQHLEKQVGDFVVKRADGQFAYQLAVVVDDAFQGITHIVRGADLLASTARQIHLQRLLGLPAPRYLHLPVAVNEAGEKLSKQTLAAPVDVTAPVATLTRVLEFLQQQPPPEKSAASSVSTLLDWAVTHWDIDKLRGKRSLPACA